jgi:hypothetical protein
LGKGYHKKIHPWSLIPIVVGHIAMTMLSHSNLFKERKQQLTGSPKTKKKGE